MLTICVNKHRATGQHRNKCYGVSIIVLFHLHLHIVTLSTITPCGSLLWTAGTAANRKVEAFEDQDLAVIAAVKARLAAVGAWPGTGHLVLVVLIMSMVELWWFFIMSLISWFLQIYYACTGRCFYLPCFASRYEMHMSSPQQKACVTLVMLLQVLCQKFRASNWQICVSSWGSSILATSLPLQQFCACKLITKL